MKSNIVKLSIIVLTFMLTVIFMLISFPKDVRAAYFEGDNLSISSGSAKNGAWAYLYVGTEYTMYVTDRSGQEYQASFKVGNGGGLNNDNAIGNLKHYNWIAGGIGNSDKRIYIDDATAVSFAGRISSEIGEAVRNKTISYRIEAKTLIYATSSKNDAGTGYSWYYATSLWRIIQDNGIVSSNNGMGSIYRVVNTIVHNLYEDDEIGGGSVNNPIYGYDVISEEIIERNKVKIRYIDQDNNIIREDDAGIFGVGEQFQKNFEECIPGYPEYNDLICTFYRTTNGNYENYGEYGIKYRYGEYENVGNAAYTQTINPVNNNIIIYAKYKTCRVTAHYYLNGTPIYDQNIGNYPKDVEETFYLYGSSWNKLPGYENYFAVGSSYSYGGNEPEISTARRVNAGYDKDQITSREIKVIDDVHIYVDLAGYGINVKYINSDTHDVIYTEFAGSCGYGNTFEHWSKDVPLTIDGNTYTKCLRSYYVDGEQTGYIDDESKYQNIKTYDRDGYYVRYQDLLNVNNGKTIYFEYQPEEAVKITVWYKYSKAMHSNYSTNCLNVESSNLKEKDEYYFKKGTNIISSEFQVDLAGDQHAGISLPGTIGKCTLSASYLIGTGDENPWHVDGKIKTRNIGVLNNNIDIVAEYYDPGGSEGDNITVTVYYVKEIGPHSKYNSTTCLDWDSIKVEGKNPNPDVYTFSKGTDISGNNAIELPPQIGEYNLSASYLWNLDNNNYAQFHVGSGYTKRSPGILNNDLIIVAEYGKGTDTDTYENERITDLDNNARGIIASEQKGNQIYDVYQGIPTHEQVYAHVKANKYLFDAGVEKVSGNRAYTVNVTVPFSFSWKCNGCEKYCPGHDSTTTNEDGSTSTTTTYCEGCETRCLGHTGAVDYTFKYDKEIQRSFSYWTIKDYQIYRINTAYVENNILVNSGYAQWNGEEVDIEKWINTTKSDHLNFHFDNSFETSITTDTRAVELPYGTSKDYICSSYSFETNHRDEFKTNAENAVPQIGVKNDKLIVEGETILAGGNTTWQDTNGTTPNLSKKVITDREFTQENYQIPISYKNKEYVTTKSQIRYISQEFYSQEKGTDILTNIGGFSNKSKARNIDNTPDLDLVNNVIVHTPVLIEASLNNVDGDKYIQKINEFDGYKTIVQDKEFTIDFNLWGEHRDIDGYGDRSYIEYVGMKNGLRDIEIKSPFDVYIIKNGNYTLLKANEWKNISGFLNTNTRGSITFKLPVWVNEGTYDLGIVLRVIAENDQDPSDRETLGIFGVNKEGESKKIYDEIPREYRAYYNIPIDVIGRVFDYKLEYTDDPSFANTMNTVFTPKMINNLPFPDDDDNLLNKYYDYAVKLGYKFKFSLKTKGAKSNEIEIIPHFYYVSKDKADTAGLQEVDVYYDNTKGNKELLNAASTFRLTTNLTKQGELPYIDSKLITDTRNIIGNKYNYNNTVGVGTVGKVLLTEPLRLRYDNIQNYLNDNTYGTGNRTQLTSNAGSADNIVSRISNWYGEYRLPSTSTFVLKGGDAKDVITKDGYILVYFDIKTNYNNGTTTSPYLSYQLPSNNTQWKKEEWIANRTITLPNGKIVTDRNTSNDYASVFIYEALLNNGKDTVGTH